MTPAGHDTALELLTMLPCAPCAARTSDLTNDLGIGRKELAAVVTRLRRAHVGIQTKLVGNHWSVWIDKDGWSKAYEMALEYYERVHERKTTAVA